MLLRALQGAGLSLLVAAGLVGTCGSASIAQEADAAASTLTIANNVEVPTFDPHKVLGIDAIVAVANLYDRLVYLDADGTIKPWLATTWETSADGKTWTFKLRQDARFHDGTPVTSEAVKFSFERAIGPDRPSSLARTYLSPIERVETPDPYTVTLVTKQPFAPLLNHLGHQTVAAILNPGVVKAHDDALGTAVDAGSGMYKLGSWNRNNELVLERNEDWWGPKPAYARIVYKPVPQVSTRVIMLETGEIDVATSIPSFEVARLETNEQLAVKSTQSVRSMYFAFNMNRALLEDVKVREALNYAVNVEGIITALLDGYGTRAQSIITPNLPYHHAAYDFTYDPSKAKSLLQEAGIAAGTKLTVVSPRGRWPMDAEVAQAVAGNLGELGFDVDLQIVGDWGQFQQTLRNGDFDLGMTAWAPGSLDADGSFSTLAFSEGSNNYGKYNSSRADELILQAGQSLDPKVRASVYRELQTLLGNDVPYLLLYNSVSFSATRKSTCNVNVRSDEAVIIKDAEPC